MSNRAHVRMKPYDRSRGHICRRYVWQGHLFRAGEWAEVPRAAAEQLEQMLQPKSRVTSTADLFDVAWSMEELRAIEEAANPPPPTAVEGAVKLDERSFRDLPAEKAVEKTDPDEPADDPPSLDELFGEPEEDDGEPEKPKRRTRKRR